MKKMNLLWGGLIGVTLLLFSCQSSEKYKDSTNATEVRVNDLLNRMTLEEKAAQLDMLCAKDILVDGKRLSEEKLKLFVDDMCIGAVHDLYPENAEIANTIQKHAIEKSRLGIPLLFIEEGLHGFAGPGSTTFPIPMGNASTWDTLLVKNIGKVIATEARAHGVHFILGPNLDLAHEIRWGRVEETFGEDPYLSARMGVNMVRGMQGKQLSDKDAVVAEPKHFGIHGIPEAGTNASTVNIGEREARMSHLYTFEKAVKEGGARGVMAAYHDIDGVPCVANSWLLDDVLRKEWGFSGIVVSDLGAVARQIRQHCTATDTEDAICKSLSAGLNMQFYDFPYDEFQKSIVNAVKSGRLSEEVLNQRVKDVLRLKFELGLFDNPYIESDRMKEVCHCESHKAISLDASRKSLILLKNEGMLPFNSSPRHITVVGELANMSLLGGYSPAQAKGITVLEALKKRFGKEVQIDFIENQIENKFKSIPNSVFFTSKGEENGLKASYFNNTTLEGTPVYEAIVSQVTEYWHNLSPAPGVNTDNFSISWEGIVKAPVSGEYEFRLSADDEARLYLSGKLVIDKWGDASKPAKESNTYKIHLTAGQIIPVRAEYVERDEFAGITLEWRLTDTISDGKMLADVAKSAAASDLTILVLGENMNIVGEGKDRQDLNMSERDIRLLETVERFARISATVVMHGRPFVMTPIEKHSKAILDAWYPGEFGGQAIVEALFGEVNPSGKLVISVPRSQGQLPVHYLKKRSFKNRYEDGTALPLYSFGHGLSYTTFEYRNLRVDKKELKKGEPLTVTFELRNTGKMKGTEVCQLYITDKVTSVSIAEKYLKGFARVELSPGEQKTVKMRLEPESFSLINADMERVVEPGEFEILVGASSSDIKMKETVILR